MDRGRGKLGYIDGTWDLFHHGHIGVLAQARARCDHLVVGVATDELSKLKGKSPAPLWERLIIVQACRYVDKAVPHTRLDEADLLRVNPDIHFVGEDYGGFGADQDKRLRYCELRDIPTVRLKRTPGVSTTEKNG